MFGWSLIYKVECCVLKDCLSDDMLSAKPRPLSRSRAFRSKRHAAGTSPAHKWRSFQNFTFYWCRKELENVEFFQNSTFGHIKNMTTRKRVVMFFNTVHRRL